MAKPAPRRPSSKRRGSPTGIARPRPPARPRRAARKAATRLAEAHADRIRALAAAVRRTHFLPKSDVGDLFQHGFIVAIRSATLFLDGRKNTATYWTYAAKRIRLAMSDFAQTRHGEVPRRHIRRIHAQGGQIRQVQLDAELLPERCQAVTDSDATELLARLCSGLRPRHAAILADRFVHGLTIPEISAKQKLTINTVRQMSYMAMQSIRSRFRLGVDEVEGLVVIDSGGRRAQRTTEP